LGSAPPSTAPSPLNLPSTFAAAGKPQIRGRKHAGGISIELEQGSHSRIASQSLSINCRMMFWLLLL